MTGRAARPAGATTGMADVDLRGLLRRVQRPIMVAVAGDSGSGKTTYTRGITRLLGDELVGCLSLDGYHKEDRAQRRQSGRSPLDPRANHLNLVRDHLERFQAGETLAVPHYNHQTGTFDEPVPFPAKPVIIVEGLHALYPELLPLFDFRLYIDTDHTVKSRWKFDRDVFRRGYDPEYARREMNRREGDYRRWIDFQKTNADVICRIHESEMASLAVDEYTGKLPDDCHHMEIIVSPTEVALPSLYLPVDLNNMTQQQALPFMLANVPSSYWGRPVNVVHIDGVMPDHALRELEREIMRLVGLPVPRNPEPGQPSTILFTQLLVAWPFLGHVLALLTGARGRTTANA